MKQVDATQLVVVDETGSNIGLTPIYARAPRGQHASPAVSRATLGKIPRMPGITFPIGHGGSHDFGRSQ